MNDRICAILRAVKGERHDECHGLARWLEEQERNRLRCENQELKTILERLMTLSEKIIALANHATESDKKLADIEKGGLLVTQDAANAVNAAIDDGGQPIPPAANA